eukprot:scaffold664568_cov34-Prasinocladus_malaysianus.AAC.1
MAASGQLARTSTMEIKVAQSVQKVQYLLVQRADRVTYSGQAPYGCSWPRGQYATESNRLACRTSTSTVAL